MRSVEKSLIGEMRSRSRNAEKSNVHRPEEAEMTVTVETAVSSRPMLKKSWYEK